MSESTIEKLQDLCEEHGCPPGINRFTWLDYMLNKVAKLEAERDALRADAVRWKWAKHQGSIQDAIDSLVGDTVTISEMEAAIDAAIAADGAQS